MSEEHWYVKELKTEIGRLNKLYRASLEALVKQCKLITELADALEPFKPLTGKEAELIQRAREAAKHE